MALLFMDGFGGNDVASKWGGASAITTIASATPRVPGGYYAVMSSGSLIKQLPLVTKAIIGLGYRSTGVGSAYITFSADGGAQGHITVTRNQASGVLEIRRGSSGGNLLASGTLPLAAGQWNYVEISVTVSDTIGEVHVRLNGQTTDEVSYVGDTKNAGTSTLIDQVLVSYGGGATTSWVSDVYILDGTGSAPYNAFLGDVAVRTLSPNGNGNSSQFTGSDGNQVDNYALVDEHPYSGTDYVTGTTVGTKDTYAMSDLPAGVTTVYAVQVNSYMQKSDAGLASARMVLRSGGTDYTGSSKALSTTANTYYDLYTQDPATSAAWTPTNVNNLESGVEIV